jgi:hypothetical protein
MWFPFFLLLRSTVTLGIDNDYDLCRGSKCLQRKKGEGVIGKKASAHDIGLDINIHHPYKPLVVAIRKF